jgi:hypothetical protein
MAQFSLFIDTASGTLVQDSSNSAAAPLPALVQGDTLNLRIYLLARTPGFPLVNPPYTIISNAGMALQVAIGDKVGNVTNYYATQFVWNPDQANQYFSAALALNTAAITALLGSGASATTWLDIQYLIGGIPTTVLEIPVTIQASVIKAGGGAPLPPGQTPLSAEYANATFLTRSVVGQIILVNANTGKKIALYVDDDGKAQMDPIQ